MSTSFFTGLLGGFNTAAEANRHQAQLDREASLKRDQEIFTALAAHENPEIANRAAEGLLNLSLGKYEPKGGRGLSQYLGRSGPANPDVQSLLDTFHSINAHLSGAAGQQQQEQTQADTVEAHPGAAAMAPPPESGSGPKAVQLTPPPPPVGRDVPLPIQTSGPLPGAAGDPMAARTPQPGVASAPPGPVGAPGVPGAPAAPGQALAAGAPPPPLPTTFPSSPKPPVKPTMQTRLYETPDEKIRRAAVAKAQGDTEGDILGWVATGMTREQAMAQVQAERHHGSASGSAYTTMQQGQLTNGTLAFGRQNRFTGDIEVLDPATGQLVPAEQVGGWQPRAVSSSASMGVDREALALATYHKRFAELDQNQQQDVILRETQLKSGNAAAAASARTTATNTANASKPLTPNERLTQETALRTDLERFVTTGRVALNMGHVIDTGYDQYLSQHAKGDSTSAQSQAIVQSFARLLDTLSSVREAEYNRTPNGQSLMNYATGKIDQWMQGGAGLAPSEVANIVGLSNAIVKDYKTFIGNQAQTTRNTVQSYGLNEANVIPADLAGMIGSGGSGAPPPGVASPPTAPSTGTGTATPAAAVPAGSPKVGDFVGNLVPAGTQTGTDPQGRKVAKDADGNVVEIIQHNGQWYFK